MRVQVDFDDEELQPALQKHLDGGPSVRLYIRAAVRYFNSCREFEKLGFKIGKSKQVIKDNDRNYDMYNEELSPGQALLRTPS